MPTEDQVRSALTHVKYPGFSRDILSFGLVKAIHVDGKNVQVDISLATRDANLPRQIHEDATLALKALNLDDYCRWNRIGATALSRDGK